MKSTAMRKLRLFSAVLSLFLLVPASIIWAQTVSSQKGLTTLDFPTQYGSVKIYLPEDMRPGDIISGTVSAEPDPKHLDMIDITRYSIRINGNGLPVNRVASSFTLQVPPDTKGPVVVELMNPKGKTTGQLNCPVQFSGANVAAEGCSMPSHAQPGENLTIQGAFDGNSANTKCLVGNKSSDILTESPRAICTPVPIDMVDPGGSRAVLVNENGKPLCSRNVSMVNMQIRTGVLELRKGQSTYIDVKITGLQGLQDKATLTINNMTPSIVNITEGNLQVIPVGPLPDSAKGVFAVHNTAVSTRNGTFSVKIDLDLPGSPPIQFEQKELPEPRPLKDEAIHIGLDVALKKIVADAGGAAGKEWDEVCDNCKGCIQSRLGEWAPKLIEKLGGDILKHFAGKAVDLIGGAVKAVGAAKEFFDKISDKVEKGEEFAKELEEKIKSGDLQVVELKPDFCVKNSYCLISGTIFYNPRTGCVLAILKCEGTKLCCPQALTKVVISYCTDEKGMPKDKPQITVIH